MATPRDTSGDAWRRHMETFRAMQPQERLRLALTMTEEANEIARAGIRTRHPEWTPTQVQEALEELLLGVELARMARRERPKAAR